MNPNGGLQLKNKCGKIAPKIKNFEGFLSTALWLVFFLGK
jgi:hypothetical protein